MSYIIIYHHFGKKGSPFNNAPMQEAMYIRIQNGTEKIEMNGF